MREDPVTVAAPRAWPLADLPLDELSARAGELAQRWAAALILQRSPQQITAVPLERIGADGPALCAQTLRAMGSDIELERLTGAGPARPDAAAARALAAIAGASDAAGAVLAAEALRGVLWEALAAELHAADAARLTSACDRLAYVCSAALAVAVAALPEQRGAPAPQGPPQAVREPGPAAADAPAVVIVDERGPPPASVAPLAQEPRAAREREAARPEPAHEIAIRDERGGEGPAAWIGSIGQQLQRFAREGLPFAVLLVELTEIERLRREQGAAAADRLALSAEELLSGELQQTAGRMQPGASAGPAQLTRERPGRYWLLAPGADRAAAKLLAERMARALGALGPAGGRPVAVAIGTASCPQDGSEAAALAAHADVGLYAARSAAHAATVRASSAPERRG